MRRRRAAGSVALLVALAGGLGSAGCSDLGDRAGDDPGTSAQVPPTDPIIETVGWAVLDGMVSVLVRNPTDQVLRRARAVITVVDGDGRAVAATATADERRCCTASDVPPDAVFGFYVQLQDPTVVVREVSMDYEDVSWAPGASEGGPVATATPVSLVPTTRGALVTAEVTTTGGPIPRAVVQAVLDAPDGSFLAVVSTTWDCLAPDRPQEVAMELFHRVEAGTSIREVNVFPESGDGGDDTPRCETPTPSAPATPGSPATPRA